jgi:1-deoxy-D-xylulose-5-phosphate synthase
MAIHRVFDAPNDHIIFDVGHQSYVHKMLTGRYEKMDTLRQAGGISGFTNREESDCDCFGAGHSSTSLSAALGFAISDKMNGSSAYTVAVVGDGAYTGGMIHEALNNCKKDLNLIIIMNENEMSISKNIGRFAENLSKIRTKSSYFKTKKATGNFLKKIPFVGNALFRFFRGIKKVFKNTLYGSNYFENMGLTYLGPINGNDYFAVENLLREAKKLNESVIVHLKTTKGKGFEPAEASPDLYHGMSPTTNEKPKKNFSKIMGETLSDLAQNDTDICAITAAMCDGTGLDTFKARFPERFFDVGIAEEHALTFAAGLSANGKKPCVAIYSTFLQRGYDNIIHDIALQNLPVVMCIDRAGLNPSDGATHHGIFDVSFLSHIPNIKIYTPIFEDSLKRALAEAFLSNGPVAIRYPNACENSNIAAFSSPADTLDIKLDFCQDPDIIIITHGKIVSEAVKAKEQLLSEKGIRVGIILLEFLKPYDKIAKAIAPYIQEKTKGIIFLEEEIQSGGMGMNLQASLRDISSFNINRSVIMAVNDSFVTERKAGENIYDSAKISAKYIFKNAIDLYNR